MFHGGDLVKWETYPIAGLTEQTGLSSDWTDPKQMERGDPRERTESVVMLR